MCPCFINLFLSKKKKKMIFIDFYFILFFLGGGAVVLSHNSDAIKYDASARPHQLFFTKLP